MAAFPCQIRHGMVILVPLDPYVAVSAARANVRSPGSHLFRACLARRGERVVPSVVPQAKRTWRSHQQRFALDLPYRERAPANYPLEQTD